MDATQYYEIRKKTWLRAEHQWVGMAKFVRKDSHETNPDLTFFVKAESEAETAAQIETLLEDILPNVIEQIDWMDTDYLVTASLIDSILKLGVPGTKSFRSRDLPELQHRVDSLSDEQQIRLFDLPSNEMNWTRSDPAHFDRYLARMAIFEMLKDPKETVTTVRNQLETHFFESGKSHDDA